MSDNSTLANQFPIWCNYNIILKDIFLLLCIGPTLFLIVILTSHFVKTGFRSAFTKICYIATITDMISLFADVFAWDLASCGLFSYYQYIETGFFPQFFTFTQNITRNFQFCLSALIAFNRFTILYWSTSMNDWFWSRLTRYLLWSSGFLSFFPSLLITWQGTFYARVGLRNWFLAAGGYDFLGLQTGFWTLIYLIVFGLIAFLFNLLVLFKLFCIRYEQNGSTSMISKAERRLCFVSLYTLFFVLLFIISQIGNLSVTLGTDLKNLCIFLTPFSANLLCLATVWIWIGNSSDLRRSIKRKFYREITSITVKQT